MCQNADLKSTSVLKWFVNFLQAKVDSVWVRFKNPRVEKNFLKHSHTVKCRHRFRVRVCSKSASSLRFALKPLQVQWFSLIQNNLGRHSRIRNIVAHVLEVWAVLNQTHLIETFKPAWCFSIGMLQGKEHEHEDPKVAGPSRCLFRVTQPASEAKEKRDLWLTKWVRDRFMNPLQT